MLEEVTSGVQVEKTLQPLTGKELQGNCSDEARFGEREHPLKLGLTFELGNAIKQTNRKKEKEFNSRILNVERVSHTPTVFSVNGGIGSSGK